MKQYIIIYYFFIFMFDGKIFNQRFVYKNVNAMFALPKEGNLKFIGSFS